MTLTGKGEFEKPYLASKFFVSENEQNPAEIESLGFHSGLLPVGHPQNVQRPLPKPDIEGLSGNDLGRALTLTYYWPVTSGSTRG
jgi:hypothetical protein